MERELVYVVYNTESLEIFRVYADQQEALDFAQAKSNEFSDHYALSVYNVFEGSSRAPSRPNGQ